MTRNQIASLLTKAEGGKSEVAIGDAREILRLLVYIDAEQVHLGGRGILMDLMTESDALVQEMVGDGATPRKAAKKVARKK